jgi:hypothetical protein
LEETGENHRPATSHWQTAEIGTFAVIILLRSSNSFLTCKFQMIHFNRISTKGVIWEIVWGVTTVV